MSTNIYALRGFKVKITEITGGIQQNKESVEKYLKVGQTYTVEKTEVHSWHTDYYFQELPNMAFSGFISEDISFQSEQDNKKHPDWAKYNS